MNFRFYFYVITFTLASALGTQSKADFIPPIDPEVVDTNGKQFAAHPNKKNLVTAELMEMISLYFTHMAFVHKIEAMSEERRADYLNAEYSAASILSKSYQDRNNSSLHGPDTETDNIIAAYHKASVYYDLQAAMQSAKSRYATSLMLEGYAKLFRGEQTSEAIMTASKKVWAEQLEREKEGLKFLNDRLRLSQGERDARSDLNEKSIIRANRKTVLATITAEVEKNEKRILGHEKVIAELNKFINSFPCGDEAKQETDSDRAQECKD